MQQACNPKIAGLFGSRPKFGGSVYRNNIVDALKVPLCPSLIGQVLRLPGGASPVGLHNASLRMTLTVPEMVGAENQVTSRLPFLLDPRRIAKM